MYQRLIILNNFNFNNKMYFNKMNIAILILAAGNSTRMGVAKQLLPVSKTTLLGVTIESALKSNVNSVFCVLGANAKAIEISISEYNIDTIFNTDYQSGLSSSIVSGINHITKKNFDSVLILLGDQPHITTKYINEMVSAHKNHPKKIVASNYKDILGVPSMIPKIYFNELLKLHGDKGAKVFLKSNKEIIIKLNNANLIDIDTKKEYEDYIKSITSE